MRTTAIVVARGGSKRVPGKALRPFGGSTLIGHKVGQLMQCERIDEVVVGSDCDEILAEAERYGASIRKRDEFHCDESRCSANEMIRNMAAMVEADFVVWAHPTNPLCGAEIYDRAVYEFMTEDRCDSLCGVTRVQSHVWHDAAPLNFDPWRERHPLASELAPVFHQNGAIFIQPHRQMLENAYFYGKKPLLFEIGAPYDFDVNTERELETASLLWGVEQQKRGLARVYGPGDSDRCEIDRVMLNGVLQEDDDIESCSPDAGWIDRINIVGGELQRRREYGRVQVFPEVAA